VFLDAEDDLNPVRFILTTGDNIYRSGGFFWLTNAASGDRDEHWHDKFFVPYADVLASIPMLPSVGNHDRGESEKEADLVQYYDNFLFPPDERVPYYTFTFGNLAQFFALNTTSRSAAQRHEDEAFGPNSTQRAWLADALARSNVPWRIPFFHHPPFTAGPDHADEKCRSRARHLMNVFADHARVAFSGHEHNFQFSEASDATRGIRFVVSGAGGKRDTGLSVDLAEARIDQHSSEHHFLRVDVVGRAMQITVQGIAGEILPLDRGGRARRLPPIVAPLATSDAGAR
jgi:hypothetical protein